MKDIKFMFGESLIWETLLVQIRGILIRYAAVLEEMDFLINFKKFSGNN